MSIQFSANLSSLRREKGVAQKQAAASLGISQALLSHYEKGIRECNLDFVKKAAAYYDVSADYLLGLTENRQQTDALLSDEQLPSDVKMTPTTVLRSVIALASQAQSNGESEEMLFADFFSLCVKKYLSAVYAPSPAVRNYCDASMERLCQSAAAREQTSPAPLCLKTVEDHALLLINQDFANAVK